MVKNKRWLTELYLVYRSRLHVNVLKGQLALFRMQSEPQLGSGVCGGRG